MAKYTILSADSTGSLENKVKHSMQDGYIPQGGVSVIFRNNSSTTYLQAMYKPDQDIH